MARSRKPPVDLDAFFAAARRETPKTYGIEAGFEEQVLRRVRMTRTREEEGAGLPFLAWRMLPAFASLLLLISLGTTFLANRSARDVSGNTQDYVEYVVLSSVLEGQ